MTAHAVSSRHRRKGGNFLLLPFALLGLLLAAAGGFVCYVLWPTWPSAPVPLDAPSLPITVSGVLFEIPPAAIRVSLQRHAGPHDRIDLDFLWPSLKSPQPDAGKTDKEAAPIAGKPAAAGDSENDRLFVTLAPLGSELPPVERLRSIYPRYVEAEASQGPGGLAVLPFRAGTPYAGEDLIYVGDHPERFFALCTRASGPLPGTCMQERLVGTAEVTLRFPRQWLGDWQSVGSGFDRLLGQLHPQGK